MIFRVTLDVTPLLSERNMAIEKEEHNSGKQAGLFMHDMPLI